MNVPPAGGEAPRPRQGSQLPTFDLRHVQITELALHLARLHGQQAPGAESILQLSPSLSGCAADQLLQGGGFRHLDTVEGSSRRVRRVHTLPDYVRSDLRILVCGLNPSPYAAETGIPFGRPGNRFWPAALRAGLVSHDRDVYRALAAGVGFTDWVKRTTRRASELRPAEYRSGQPRLTALLTRMRPRVLCFVGLEGFRRVYEPRARAGWVNTSLATCPVYLMPSTSGLNARTHLSELTEHLICAAQASA